MNESISQVDGKFYKKCKIILLPTKDNSSVVKIINDRGNIARNEALEYIGNAKNPKQTNERALLWEPYHVYILSNEEIKEGDWVLDLLRKRLILSSSLSDSNQFNAGGYEEEHKYSRMFLKVIASTDPSLIIYDESKYIKGSPTVISLPRPSNDFLQAYTKQNGIEEVLLEVRQNDFTEFYKNKEVWTYPIKVAQDNTVTIRKAVDSFPSLEEYILSNPSVKGFTQAEIYHLDKVIKEWASKYRDFIKYNHTKPVVEDKNPNNLQIGKEYWFNYLPTKDNRWFKAKITRFTDMGYAWMESNTVRVAGIVSQEHYEISETEPISIKNSWSREEVEKLLQEQRNNCHISFIAGNSTYKYSEQTKESIINAWSPLK